MKKRIVIAYLLNFLLISFCANGFELLRRDLRMIFVILPLFSLSNLFCGFFCVRTKSVRLRICHHGAMLLAVFLGAATFSVAYFILYAIRILPLGYMDLIWSVIWCVALYCVVFWNGIVCVYLTSVQLGIKQRVIGGICGMIPVVNLFVLFSIIKTSFCEVWFEAKKEMINAARRDERVCATKYPILLVHGVCFRDSKVLSYWGRIPRELEANGARVFYGNHRSAAAISVCAEELLARIHEILRETGAEKVNIIAHSKGGLDCRYAIAKLGAAPFVASFTTVNSPHRGCHYADTLLTVIPDHVKNKVARTYDRTFRYLGDIDPDFLTAMCNLTASYCDTLTKELDDDKNRWDIYRQSIMTVMKNSRSAGFPLSYTYHIVKQFDGENDGLVSESSAQFGEKFTVIRPSGKLGISHMDVIDMPRRNIPEFDAREFFVQLVSDLKSRGF